MPVGNPVVLTDQQYLATATQGTVGKANSYSLRERQNDEVDKAATNMHWRDQGIQKADTLPSNAFEGQLIMLHQGNNVYSIHEGLANGTWAQVSLTGTGITPSGRLAYSGNQLSLSINNVAQNSVTIPDIHPTGVMLGLSGQTLSLRIPLSNGTTLTDTQVLPTTGGGGTADGVVTGGSIGFSGWSDTERVITLSLTRSNALPAVSIASTRIDAPPRVMNITFDLVGSESNQLQLTATFTDSSIPNIVATQTLPTGGTGGGSFIPSPNNLYATISQVIPAVTGILTHDSPNRQINISPNLINVYGTPSSTGVWGIRWNPNNNRGEWTQISGGTPPPVTTSTLYYGSVAANTAPTSLPSSMQTITQGNHNDQRFTVPTFSGNQYFIVLQPATVSDVTAILVNGLGGDFANKATTTISSVSYEYWVSLYPWTTDTIGDAVDVRR